ncbi:MAG TPA: Rho termination factor N-terminal domain-containing protein [Egibacteraceae bacterium]|nr:Rho termination factor N-terminal domain-containing protein [Actinomycetota bacterium]HWB72216.1 Rho termination factor N-terminal domain-containing protein [Egibacteraceae bacterium]
MARSKQEILDTLMERYGRTYAEELGIDVGRNTPGPLFELLVACLLMSARISTTIALRAGRALLRDHGLTTADKMADASWQERVDALGEGGYVRYDESTSSYLGETSELLVQRYDGDLRNLREQAGRDPAKQRRLLKEFKGLGDVGVDIFFREVQVAWEELYPFADDRVLGAAKRLGLGSSVDDLTGVVDRADFARLVGALTRVHVDDRYDEVRTGHQAEGESVPTDLQHKTKAELYEQARQQDVPGRSKMSKDELIQALAED